MIYDVDPNELIEKTAEELKKIESIKPEKWAAYVKTGVYKERPPARGDWWYVRAASILRKLVRYGPIGVSKLRKKYGGKKNRGVKPEHFFKGSGNIIRKILQQLEKAELVKDVKEGKYKGRILTKKGKEFLNNIAYQISGVKPEVKVKVKKEKPKVKKERKKEKPKIKKEKIEKVKKEEKEKLKVKKEEDPVKKMVEKTKDFVKGKKETAEDILKEV